MTGGADLFGRSTAQANAMAPRMIAPLSSRLVSSFWRKLMTASLVIVTPNDQGRPLVRPRRRYSGLMPASLTIGAHFSASARSNAASSAGVEGLGGAPSAS